ncbi:hypothetical protein TWF970_000469 [Orbilia oligospora]|nr:hypothetical protein TWF970_000469 [Orbilia oligospora]
MDSPNHKEHIISMMEGMRLDLDSKSADIAEIKSNLALLTSYIIGAANKQANSPSEQNNGAKDVSPPRQLSAETNASQDGGNSDTLSASLTNVSHSTEPRAISSSDISGEGLRSLQGSPKPNNQNDSDSNIENAATKSPSPDNNHFLHGLSTPLANDDEITRPDSSGGVSISSSIWQIRPQTEVPSDCEPKFTVQQPEQQKPQQQQTTKVSINGVTRAIPSSIKGPDSFKKPPMPFQPGSFAPPYMKHNNAFGASATHSFHGWQGGPQPHPHFAVGPSAWHAHPAGQWQGAKHPGAFGPAAGPHAFGPFSHRYEHYATGLHAPKTRVKTCTNCGDPTHFYKHCPQRSATFNGGRPNKQFGPDGGKKCLSFFGFCKNFKECDCPNRASSFSIDRQLEFIDYMIEVNRVDSINKTAQNGIPFEPPCA